MDEFVYLPLMHWSPYRPSFRLCEYLFTDAMNHIHLRALFNFKNLYELAMLLLRDGVGIWRLKMYRLHSSSRPLGRLDPQLLELEDTFSLGELEFRFVKLRSTKARKLGALDAIDDGDVSDVSGDGSDDLGCEKWCESLFSLYVAHANSRIIVV